MLARRAQRYCPDLTVFDVRRAELHFSSAIQFELDSWLQPLNEAKLSDWMMTKTARSLTVALLSGPLTILSGSSSATVRERV
jgi:hypothetical protein